MDSSIWSNIQEKHASFLVLRGDEVSRIKVTGILVNRNARKMLEQLEAGEDPKSVGGKVETFQVGTIGKIEVGPGEGSLVLYREADGAKMKFSTPQNDADAIAATIMNRAGRKFRSDEEEIGVIEALVPPAVTGLFAGLLWGVAFSAASDQAAGKEVVAKGRRKGLQEILIWVADTLGYNGTVAVGVLLLLAIVGWAGLRIAYRPRRSVWAAETA